MSSVSQVATAAVVVAISVVVVVIVVVSVGSRSGVSSAASDEQYGDWRLSGKMRVLHQVQHRVMVNPSSNSSSSSSSRRVNPLLVLGAPHLSRRYDVKVPEIGA